MKYIKTYEIFGFKSKKSKSQKTWQEKFDDIYKTYLKNKDKEEIPFKERIMAEVKETQFSISKNFKNLVFYGETGYNHNWEVLDFELDPKSKKGVYKITPKIYEEYKKKVQEVSDWLDDRSEKEFNKSKSSISKDGSINMEFNELDLAIEELNYKVKEGLKLGKEYEFEMSYHLWSSISKNDLVIETRKLKIDDIEIGFSGNRFWAKLFTKCPFGEKAEMWIEDDTSHEYYDFEKNNWPYNKDKIIRMSLVEKEMTRAQKREFEKNRKYPYAFSFDVSPSEWKSMELIKDVTSILKELNNSIKNK